MRESKKGEKLKEDRREGEREKLRGDRRERERKKNERGQERARIEK